MTDVLESKMERKVLDEPVMKEEAIVKENRAGSAKAQDDLTELDISRQVPLEHEVKVSVV